MYRYKRVQLIVSSVKTLIGCIGWGLLGYLVMTSMDGQFWLGWCIVTAAVCVGAYTVDRLIDVI